MDDFDQFPDLMAAQPMVEPLPMGPAQPPAQPQPQQGGNQWGEIAKILPLLAAAGAKGGRVGIAAFLQGLQQSQMRRQQDQRYQQQQARLTANDQAAADYRQQQLMLQANQQAHAAAQQQRAQQIDFLKTFSAALNSPNLTDDSGVRAVIDLYGAQGERLGIPRATVEQFAMKSVLPKDLLQKRVTGFLKQADKDTVKQWIAGRANLQMEGQLVPFETWSQYVPIGTDENGKPILPTATNTDKRGFATKDITLNGKRMLAGYDPDTNAYYAPGDTKTPLTGNIQEYQKPTTAGDGLTSRQQAQASAQSRTFESLPVVKNTQKISEAVAFVNGLDLNTKNPADDQALIYAFAKAMDPDSVVREGEYATVQKYSQSWLESFGFNAQRVLANSEFLTPQARANLKKTILARFNAARPQYDAVRRSYVTKINKITGQSDGEDWLTDYGAAFPSNDAAPKPTGKKQRIGRFEVTVE